MWHAILCNLNVRGPHNKEAPYCPVRYLKQFFSYQAAANADLVMKVKCQALLTTYGVESAEIKGSPFSYKDYLWYMNGRRTWGG